MAFPGASWGTLVRNPQTPEITGRLSAEKFTYQGCNISSNNCSVVKPANGKSEYGGNCDSCTYKGYKKWRSHCTDGSSPCDDIANSCRAAHNPSNIPSCGADLTTLYDDYRAVNPATQTYPRFIPPDDAMTCYRCVGTCAVDRICRGPVNLELCMDLGSTGLAWTVADRKPDEAKDLDMKTFATDRSKIFNASANVSYVFNLEPAFNDDRASSFALWTFDVRTKENQTVSIVNGGPGPIQGVSKVLSQQIRDSNFVLAAVAYVYDNFFRDQFVGGTFYAIKNTLDANTVNNYVHTSCTKILGLFQSQFTDTPAGATSLRDLLLTFIRPPRPSQRPDLTPVLTLYVTYRQLLSVIQDPHAPSSLISHFLRDQQGKVARKGSATTKGEDPILTWTGIADVRAQMVILDPNNYRLGDLIPVTATGALAPPSGYDISNMVAAHYTIDCEISKWSIMLAAYFQEAAYTTPKFSPATCSAMQSQIPTVARLCFESANPDQQTVLLGESCPVRYSPPPAVTGQQFWLLYQDSKDPYRGGSLCSCYNANLGNPDDEDKQDAKATSRCFSTTCTEDERQELGLNDAVCSAPDKCALAELWVASKDPAQRGRDLDAFDWTRFALLCGKTIQPLAEVYYSWKIALGVGCALLALSIMGAVLLAVLPRPKLPAGEYWGTVVALIVLSILLGVGSGWAFAGEAVCKNKKPTCVSRLFKTPLLQVSCPYTAQCECQFDQDCGGSCGCTAGFCTSENGSRATKRVNETKPRPEILVPLVAVAIAVAVIAGVTSVKKLGKAGAAGLGLGLGVAFLALAFGLGIQVDSGILVFEGPPDCGNNLPQTLTVLDVARQVSVTFPTLSRWTPSGFPSGGIGLTEQNPYLLPAEQLPEVEAEVQKAYPEFKATEATRSLLFLDNNADDPSARQFYIFEMPETQKGNTIAVSRVQNLNNVSVDLWTVAWGKVSANLDVVGDLPTDVTVETRYGRLYSDARLVTDRKDLPTQTIGPQCLSLSSDADFFHAAKQALGAQWDGESYQAAIKTVQEDEAKPWFYYMQVSPSLAVSCQYGTTFECSTGAPDKDLASFPCRTNS